MRFIPVLSENGRQNDKKCSKSHDVNGGASFIGSINEQKRHSIQPFDSKGCGEAEVNVALFVCRRKEVTC